MTISDKEFKKRNAELLRKQEKVAKRRDQQSAVKISESCSTRLNELNRVAKEPACEKCGARGGDDLITLPKGRYGLLCLECMSERLDWLISDEARQHLRKARCAKDGRLKEYVEAVIPKGLLEARLCRLGTAFKKKLLAYNHRTGVAVYGPVGTGKSFALCALLRSMIASGLNCRRIGYEKLCLQIRDTFKAGSEISELDVIRQYEEADVLLLEDLGCSKPIGSIESEFSLRVIYALLDSRLEHERPTLISTNKTLAEMRVSFDERIASRLSTLTWIGVGGADKRKQK